jgi:hypothetical protein
MLALAGFYLAVALSADYGAHGLLADLWVALAANRRYFTAGLVSGPLLGSAGAWWSSHRTLRMPAVIGVLLLGEPVAVAAIGSVPALSRFGSGWHTSPGVYAAEFALGAIVLAGAYLLPRKDAA